MRLLILFLLCASSYCAYSKTDLHAIANSQQWQKLLYYKQVNNAYKSEIMSGDFFISPKGNNQPLAELKATISALQDVSGINTDQHAQCQFRGRYLWLRTQLPEIKSANQAKCKNFHQWLNDQKIESISLVFASGYFANPASFFGHSLIKFNSAQPHLLDLSINFGAITPDRENAIAYVYKGLTGSYKSRFRHGAFYAHDIIYGSNQLRDLWEYKLNLTDDKVQLIVAHIWEILDKNFKYYYLSDNCGYRISQVINLITETSILSTNKFWKPPADLLKKMVHSNNNLVEEITYHPSRQNRLYQKLSTFDDKHRDILHAFVKNEKYTPKYKRLSVKEKIHINDALIDYAEIRISKDKIDRYVDLKKVILKEMLTLTSIEKYHPTETVEPSGPHTSQNSTLIRAGYTNGKNQNFNTLQLRASYFDILNIDSGRAPYSEIVMGDLHLSNRNDQYKIDKLSIVNMSNFNIPRSGLPGDNKPAWTASLGWRKQNPICDNCLSFGLDLGYGKAYALNEKFAIYGLANLSFADKTPETKKVHYGYSVGSIISINTAYKLKFELSADETYDDSYKIYHIENRFGSSPNWDIRVSLFKNNVNYREVNSAFSYYF